MADIEIIKSENETQCDIYGCGNFTKSSISKPGENMGQRIIMCEECMQNIINAAPIEMIENRAKIENMVLINHEEFVPEDSIHGKITNVENCTPCNDIKENLENVGNLLEEVENTTNLEDKKYPELREIAKTKGLTIPIGMSKVELLALLAGN